MKKIHPSAYIAALLIVVATCFTACSSTSGVPDDDQLFIGLKKIAYNNYEKNDHFVSIQEEVEAALATAPNGALFGSSYYRTPFPYRLWIWNAFNKSESPIGKWITKSFGKRPVLMSWVNPTLRAQVAQQMLRAHGYFGANVSYEITEQKNPKEAKIAYDVNLGHLYTIDSLSYKNYPQEAMSLIEADSANAAIHNGDAFDVSTLDGERNRISNLLRNHGYFYYQSGYATYLADTLSAPGKALLHFQLADSLSPKILRPWYIGRTEIQLRKNYADELTDSIRRRSLTVKYKGKKSPIRPRVILRDMKIRPRQLYSYENHMETVNKLTSTGLFSMVDLNFAPRDTSTLCDTLDLTLNCIFDKPYDIYVETNLVGKSSGRLGPGLTVGFVKRNAFRGGEKLEINLKGSYEWQTGHRADGTSSKLNSYEYGADASLELPRLVLPFFRHTRWYTTPSTTIKVSSDVINRSQFFKRHIVSGELTYKFQPTATSVHQFSPLTLQYEYMQKKTDAFNEVLQENPYLLMSMADQFVPKMTYTYTYSSPSNYQNPIYWQTSISEASNILSLGYMAAGKKWGTKGKQMFKNPYAQFIKIESDLRKTWKVATHSQLVGHISAGAIWAYGNSTDAPYSEQFYIGGANSIRAFNIRSVGPGAYYTSDNKSSYMDQTGDIKLQLNLEYRPRLFGNLYGAIFLDAGNVWAMHDDGYRANSKLQLKNLLQETALGTGVGIRYDLEFFVLRLDWGIGLHLPYKSGFYNFSSFKDSQSLHFAIGYPF